MPASVRAWCDHYVLRARGGAIGAGSPAIERGRHLRMKNRCGEGMAQGMGAVSGAHWERVIKGEVRQWQRGGGASTVGSSHGGQR
jgi:hypothetical protein